MRSASRRGNGKERSPMLIPISADFHPYVRDVKFVYRNFRGEGKDSAEKLPLLQVTEKLAIKVMDGHIVGYLFREDEDELTEDHESVIDIHYFTKEEIDVGIIVNMSVAELFQYLAFLGRGYEN
jgi:hypothetical protein